MSDELKPGAEPRGDPGRSENRGDREGRPRYDERSNYDDRPRGPMSVKARLRARARKKQRKTRKKMFQRSKVCRFCADKRVNIDYKEPKTLRLFISETGKITPRRISVTCSKHQRQLAIAIKRARQIALLPYAPSHM